MKAEEKCTEREEIQILKYVEADDNNKRERIEKIEVVKEPDDESIWVDPKISKILNPSTSVTGYVYPSDRKIIEIQVSIIKTSSSLLVKAEEECRKREEIQLPIIMTSSLPIKAEEQWPSGSTDVRPLVNGLSLEQRSILCRKSDEETREILRNLILKLPFVSTKDGIPNRKKAGGFLHGYKSGNRTVADSLCLSWCFSNPS
ncbi:hypothetical protein FXO38_35066 [Capsicum annuum]|nr:hypothetical protein FXO38_35066 [Capsicum annuum]